MKQTKEQVIENLKNISYNVMFTKEELINIIENVEENTRFPFNSYLDEITELVVSTLDDMDTDELISEYDIGLNNKEVYVESFNINERKVTTKIKTELNEYFKSIVTAAIIPPVPQPPKIPMGRALGDQATIKRLQDLSHLTE